MVASLSGKPMYLWRAVDGEGEVLEIPVQPKRDKAAAMKSVVEKRQLRNKKRRKQEIVLDDYVLTQPPVYGGPARSKALSCDQDPKKTCNQERPNATTFRASSRICKTCRSPSGGHYADSCVSLHLRMSARCGHGVAMRSACGRAEPRRQKRAGDRRAEPRCGVGRVP